jgi:hypothetical protein
MRKQNERALESKWRSGLERCLDNLSDGAGSLLGQRKLVLSWLVRNRDDADFAAARPCRGSYRGWLFLFQPVACLWPNVCRTVAS